MAKKDQQYVPVFVQRQQVERQFVADQVHDYFEMIYIVSGAGNHFKEKVKIPFVAGDLFVVRTGEEHSFDIIEPSEVILIRVTEKARLKLKELIDNSNGKAVALFKAQLPINPKVAFSGKDRTLAEQILTILCQLSEDIVCNENLCYFQLICLVGIIERNLDYPHRETLPPQKNISLILKHIHKHLLSPQMLGLEYIAEKFNTTPNQLGIYFRKQTGKAVKQYITEHRLELIGEKVAKTELSFSEIAHLFGYTDESHFYKSFKKCYGQSPSQYRQQHKTLS
ncbi:AraC-type DNA-binding protein [Flexibacter flexilis DSM 6793]|uniref:AraC-type DNA-binding protein n=1 Tax=Flexibacter flexilis DSM 6793 TaxID=927664 RepID=A0A1I1ECL6_9BACT|nr:AraC family transcriptional regulator [Flexibacter flexilis]SFB84787.1 AraC-type DNA-binding protein [Flexibacter flexilis DSM 6793]